MIMLKVLGDDHNTYRVRKSYHNDSAPTYKLILSATQQVPCYMIRDSNGLATDKLFRIDEQGNKVTYKIVG